MISSFINIYPNLNRWHQDPNACTDIFSSRLGGHTVPLLNNWSHVAQVEVGTLLYIQETYTVDM